MSPTHRPFAAARARLLAAAEREPATRPGTWSRRVAVGCFLVIAWMAAALGAMGIRLDWAELPSVEWTQTLVTLFAVALVASAAGLARGRSMVGVATESLSATAWGLPVLLLMLVFLIDPRGPSTTVPFGGQGLATHAKGCDLFTFVIALPLIGIGIWFSRGLTPGRPGLAGACIGLGAATWAHLLMRIHCPIGGAGHAVVGHFLPALPLMALGAGGMWLLDRRQSGLHKDTS